MYKDASRGASKGADMEFPLHIGMPIRVSLPQGDMHMFAFQDMFKQGGCIWEVPERGMDASRDFIEDGTIEMPIWIS